MADIIKCKDCKYLEKWRTPERSEQFSYLYVCGKYVISNPSPDDYCSKAERKEEKNSGKWIETDSDDACWYMCSECHRRTDEKSYYCPDCGCRMVEPQESEE